MTEPISDEGNPYVPSALIGPPEQTHPKKKIHWRPLFVGALWSVLSSFPIAAFLALLFRFPVPLIGYVSGVEAIVPAMVGVLVYGVLLGGFLLLGSFGAIIAFSVKKMEVGNMKHKPYGTS